ncbi:HdaA/DnaA family protein [Aureimonas frigidaquae]|uniref:Hda lid domain-containing protein n=1 Tax=Aureimonas frigidaquae TaxID=424757 RepID=A0A0P0Z474_9HYPH|nr:hypothetical protein [Aureimonas frigidaquae]BAT28888.1 hypothetical protein [Aureimonas frigidaquae]
MTKPRQLPFELPHRASFARADFIETESNRLAVDAVDAWPAWPHPVLFLSGPAGSGKTHLASAFALEHGAVVPAHGQGFAQEPGFVAVIDDIDRTDLTEPEIFAVVNAARTGLGTVLITSRVSAPALKVALPDLASRLRAATQVAIGAPDDALLEGVLFKLFADRQMDVDPRLLSYVVPRMERSVVAAQTLVDRLDRESLAAGRRVTRALVSAVLDDLNAA